MFVLAYGQEKAQLGARIHGQSPHPLHVYTLLIAGSSPYGPRLLSYGTESVGIGYGIQTRVSRGWGWITALRLVMTVVVVSLLLVGLLAIESESACTTTGCLGCGTDFISCSGATLTQFPSFTAEDAARADQL